MSKQLLRNRQLMVMPFVYQPSTVWSYQTINFTIDFKKSMKACKNNHFLLNLDNLLLRYWSTAYSITHIESLLFSCLVVKGCCVTSNLIKYKDEHRAKIGLPLQPRKQESRQSASNHAK